MILQDNLTTVEKSDNFQTTDFRIDPKYKNKVLWMLINQYRYKVRTPVQEIISNARDAQRENGNPDTPIKIQLPTKLEPIFAVRDYGVGMSEERIRTIFTSFGASTKNADNTQTGGFGIGAKSPLAYTDQFNIKTYIDGTFWVYAIAKNEKNGISIHLLEKGSTEEVNGTEVQIPVKSYDTRDFRNAANRCTMFWNVKPNFNNVEDKIDLTDKGINISKGITVYKQSTDLNEIFTESIVLTVDGIPYQVDYSLLNKVKTLKNIKNKLHYNSTIVIDLNTGDIELLQTRESLDESEYTLSQLSKYGFKAFNELELYLASCLNAKDLQGRIDQYTGLYQNFSNILDHKFDLFRISNSRISVPSKLNIYGYDFIGRSGKLSQPKKKTYTTEQYNQLVYTPLRHDQLPNVFYDDIKDIESANIKARRLRKYIVNTKAQNVLVINKGGASNFEYIRTLRMLGARKLSTLPLPVKVPRGVVNRQPKTKTNKVMLHLYGRYGKGTLEIDVVNNTNKYIYGDYSCSYSLESRAWQRFLEEHNYTFCKVSATVKKKIKDDVNFTHIDDYIANIEISEKTLNQYMTYHFSKGKKYTDLKDRVIFICENSTRIGDKVLTKMANIVNVNKDKECKTVLSLPIIIDDIITSLYCKKISMIERVFDRINARLDNLYNDLVSKDSYNSTKLKKRSEALYYINTTYRRLF